MNKKVVFWMALGLSAVCLVGLVMAQPGGGAGGAGGRGAGAGARAGAGFGAGPGMGMGMGMFGRFNAQVVRQALGVSDQEWAQLEPKVQQVIRLQNEARVSITMTVRRGRGGDTGADQPATPTWNRPSAMAQMSGQELTEGQKAAEALLDLLENKNSDIKQIQEKVQALRNIRQKAQKDLETAQAELKKVLNERQQATLVLMGLLD